jgi:hypothetical protein
MASCSKVSNRLRATWAEREARWRIYRSSSISESLLTMVRKRNENKAANTDFDREKMNQAWALTNILHLVDVVASREELRELKRMKSNERRLNLSRDIEKKCLMRWRTRTVQEDERKNPTFQLVNV